jgi:glycosyltransferase involved in cell wall biosynthesis
MMTKLDIQIVVGPTPPPVGGVSSSVSNLVRLFKQEGIGSRIFSTSSGNEREDLYARKGLKSYFRSLSVLIKFVVFLTGAKSVNYCHVFVVSNSAFIRDCLILIVANLFRKKVIIHFHSKVQGELFLSPRFSWFLGWGLSLGDSVFVLSKKHKEHFSSCVPRKKLKILENYVFSQDFYGSEPRGNEWLYVGRLTEKKGFYDLINAVEMCVVSYGFPDLKVHCLGVAETEIAQQKLEDLIEEKGLQNNLILHGVVQGEGKFHLFSHCAGLIFPSHFENSPVVLKEAISAGLPVISSDISANKAILERAGNAVFFEVGVSDKLGKTLSDLASDKAQQEKLSLNAKNAFKYDESYAKEVILESLK